MCLATDKTARKVRKGKEMDLRFFNSLLAEREILFGYEGLAHFTGGCLSWIGELKHYRCLFGGTLFLLVEDTFLSVSVLIGIRWKVVLRSFYW